MIDAEDRPLAIGPRLAKEATPSPLVAIRSVIGRPVHGREGLRGRLRDLSFDDCSGKFLYAHIGLGGLLGFGENLVVISWSLLRFEPRRQAFWAPLSLADVRRARKTRKTWELWA